MSNVVDFKKPRLKAKAKAKGKTLCGRGFHKWRIDQTKQFDVQRGALVTIRRCERCGKRKTTLD